MQKPKEATTKQYIGSAIADIGTLPVRAALGIIKTDPLDPSSNLLEEIGKKEATQGGITGAIENIGRKTPFLLTAAGAIPKVAAAVKGAPSVIRAMAEGAAGAVRPSIAIETGVQAEDMYKGDDPSAKKFAADVATGIALGGLSQPVAQGISKVDQWALNGASKKALEKGARIQHVIAKIKERDSKDGLSEDVLKEIGLKRGFGSVQRALEWERKIFF